MTWGFNDKVNGRKMHNRFLAPNKPTVLPFSGPFYRRPDLNGHMNAYHAIRTGNTVPVFQQVSVTPKKPEPPQKEKVVESNAPKRVYAKETSASSTPTPPKEEFEIAEYGYGKNHVKLLHVQRNGALHTIREYEIDTHLRLNSKKDYLEGNNQDIIATDTQKNTVYILAKKHGVKSPEEFAMLLCSHFLYVYPHVEEASVNIEEYPWERLEADELPHNHAFVFSPSAFRVCTVTQKRHESPKIRSGLRGLRILKTTQSAFRDFLQDEFRTLPDSNDRIFSTIVTSSWEYSTAVGVNFDDVWQTVKDCILDKFAGPPDSGVFSPSVQNTLYLAEKQVLEKVSQVEKIEMRMPNKHYVPMDMSAFPQSLVGSDNKEVYVPFDKPAGNIHAELKRKVVTSKL